MRRFLILIAAISLSVSANAQGEDPALRSEIQKVYRQFDQLVSKMDVKSTLKMFHPGFVNVDLQGKTMNYSETKANYIQMAAATKDVSVKTTVVHVAGSMQEATAWISMVVNYTAKQGDRWVKMKMTRRYAETLRKDADGWRFLYSQGLPTDEPWPF